jgi:hypothetical protein
MQVCRLTARLPLEQPALYCAVAWICVAVLSVWLR